MFIIKQITKWHHTFDHACNQINNYTNMGNETISSQKKAFPSVIYNFLFSSTDRVESNSIKVTILRKNQNLQQSLIGTNGKETNISHNYLVKKRHMFKGLVLP